MFNKNQIIYGKTKNTAHLLFLKNNSTNKIILLIILFLLYTTTVYKPLDLIILIINYIKFVQMCYFVALN